MKYIRKRIKFLKENTEAPVRVAPTKPVTKPQPPVKPEPPQEPDWTTPEPTKNPGIKAEDDQTLATKIASRLRDEMEKTGEDIEKYL